MRLELLPGLLVAWSFWIPVLANPIDSETLTNSGKSWDVSPSYGRDSLLQHGLGLLDREGWAHCGNALLSCDMRARSTNSCCVGKSAHSAKARSC